MPAAPGAGGPKHGSPGREVPIHGTGWTGGSGCDILGVPLRKAPPEGRHAIVTAASWRVLAFSWILFAACSSDGPGSDAPERVVPSVEAVQARHGSLPLTQRLSGAIRARNQVEIYPRISAVITEVLVQNGDAVREGDALVRLRDAEFRERLKQANASHRIAIAQLRRAEADAKEARAALERVRSLDAQQLSSDAELVSAEARAEGAEAEIELAKARVAQAMASAEEQEENLSQTVVRAPIDGSMGNRDAEVGMLATPGERLFTIGQLDSIRVDVVLTDRMLAYIEEGQRAEVRAGALVTSAPIARISPFLHPVTHSTHAEIDFANPDRALKPGMFVTVDVFYGESDSATLVPLSALYEDPVTGRVGVFVSQQDFDAREIDEQGVPQSVSLSDPVRFLFVGVELLAEGRMEAAVRGVEQGDWVVTVGQNLLGGENPTARVRPVAWDRVQRLQRLQREDLMEDVIEARPTSR